MLTRIQSYRCAIVVCSVSAVVLHGAATSHAQCAASVIQTLRPDYITSDDRFADAVAVDGTWVAVGAPNGESATFSVTGTVTMYEIVPGAGSPMLIERQRLIAPDAESGDKFGSAVAIDGTTMVIGAPWKDDLGANVGGAYTYEFNGSEWVYDSELLPFDYEPNDSFGLSVAIRGNQIAVASPYRRCCGGTTVVGLVHVFQQSSGGAWHLYDTIADPVTGSSSGLGLSLAFHGDSLLAGAPFGASVILVFDDNGTAYEFESRLFPQTTNSEGFGIAMEIEDDQLFVGAPGDTIDGHQSGAVHVYEANAFGQWNPAGLIRPMQPAAGLYFGWSVSAHWNSMIIGAGNEIDGQSLAGAAFLFNRVQGQWLQRDRLSPTDMDDHAQYSRAVACYGELVMIGVPNSRELLPGFGDLIVYRASHACSCAADVADENGLVDVFDLIELLANWGADGAGAALDAPYNSVDVFDLLRLLQLWGPCP